MVTDEYRPDPKEREDEWVKRREIEKRETEIG
jgi:hypothetical protein